VIVYIHTKFVVSCCSRLGCVFYTAMDLKAISDRRWQLFQHFKYFSKLLLMMYVYDKFRISNSNSVKRNFDPPCWTQKGDFLNIL